MPRVTPHYAVKCFPDQGLLATLASLGCGFDCASAAEAQQVLALGVAPRRLVFANPCKRPTDLACLRRDQIPHTTFDSVDEVAKLKVGCPGVGALLRLRADDPTARLPFGVKYGATPGEVPSLLAACASQGVRLAGVSFHVGSGAGDALAFRAALVQARRVRALQVAADPSALVRPWLLDIGGGFGGGFRPDTGGAFCAAGSAFDPRAPDQVCHVINAALDELFPASDFPGGLTVISEPGRYFAECASHVVTHVFGKRERLPGGSGTRKAKAKVGPVTPLAAEAEPHHSSNSSANGSFDNGSSSSGEDEGPPRQRVRPQRLATCVAAHFAGAAHVALGANAAAAATARTPPDAPVANAAASSGGAPGAVGGVGGARRRRPARLNQRFAAHFAAQPWPPPGPLPGTPMRTKATYSRDDDAAANADGTANAHAEATRAAEVAAEERGEVHYYIGDGLYGAFNAIVYDGWLPKAVPFRVDALTGAAAPCTAPGPEGTTATVFGPTCDSLDMVFCALPDCPRLDVGDWLLFPNCGAYTQAGATDFNGIPSTFRGGVRNHYVRAAGHTSCAMDDALPVLFSPEAPVSVSKNF
jgi:diaminopimelate decarboxylase